ncbi:MAG: DUF2624 domain-containing protein [Bacillaceae bacterium]|nr:DUF2624 domain-containing protein [Bacillaceae bacterium]
MNPLILQIVNNKLNTLSETELSNAAKQYGFSITSQQAKKIITILRSETINIADENQRTRILTNIRNEVDQETERKFFALLKQYEQYL